VATLPPELMTPEQREERAAEVEREIARLWVRYAMLEVGLFWVPFGVLALVYVVSGSISETVLVGVGIALLGLATMFTLYWITKRIAPLQGELNELQGGGS